MRDCRFTAPGYPEFVDALGLVGQSLLWRERHESLIEMSSLITLPPAEPVIDPNKFPELSETRCSIRYIIQFSHTTETSTVLLAVETPDMYKEYK